MLNNNAVIHSGYFYSASSSPLLLRSAPDAARMLCRSFTPNRHRQLRVKDLPKVPTWRLERPTNPRTHDLSEEMNDVREFLSYKLINLQSAEEQKTLEKYLTMVANTTPLWIGGKLDQPPEKPFLWRWTSGQSKQYYLYRPTYKYNFQYIFIYSRRTLTRLVSGSESSSKTPIQGL